MWIIGGILLITALGGGGAAAAKNSDGDALGCGCGFVVIGWLFMMGLIDYLFPTWLGAAIVFGLPGVILSLLFGYYDRPRSGVICAAIYVGVLLIATGISLTIVVVFDLGH